VDMTRITQESVLLSQLEGLLDPAKLDYIVINHMEPDHTGAIKILCHLAPHAQFLCSAKAQAMLDNYYGINENVRVVADGEQINLGNKTLTFHSIPFVHWPETMATFETTQKVLFSCDAFGGYGALRGAIFDDQTVNLDLYIREALRYYVNIIARFSAPVLKAIAKLSPLAPDVVAPSHGLVWRKNPGQIISLYEQWASCASQPGDPGVTLIYGSMYGNTEAMMNAVAEGISASGLPLEIYDAARTHASYILPSLWTRSGVIVGAPTYEVSLFPPMAALLDIIVQKRILNRQAAYFGSFGWSGGALKTTQQILEPLLWHWQDPLEFQGGPTQETLKRGEVFGRTFAESLKVK